MTKKYGTGEFYHVQNHGESKIITVGKHLLFMRELETGAEFVISKETLPHALAKEVYPLSEEEAAYLRKGDELYNGLGLDLHTVWAVYGETFELKLENGYIITGKGYQRIAAFNFVTSELKAELAKRAAADKVRLMTLELEDIPFLSEIEDAELYTKGCVKAYVNYVNHDCRTVTVEESLFGEGVARSFETIAEHYRVKREVLEKLRQLRYEEANKEAADALRYLQEAGARRFRAVAVKQDAESALERVKSEGGGQ